jgi:hypothetical protein
MAILLCPSPLFLACVLSTTEEEGRTMHEQVMVPSQYAIDEVFRQFCPMPRLRHQGLPPARYHSIGVSVSGRVLSHGRDHGPHNCAMSASTPLATARKRGLSVIPSISLLSYLTAASIISPNSTHFSPSNRASCICSMG